MAWCVVVVVLACTCLAACSLSRLVGVPATPVGTSTVQEGAPYPADMEHLDQILTVGRGLHRRKGQELPKGTQVVSVTPALNFATNFPDNWGYVIAFTREREFIEAMAELAPEERSLTNIARKMGHAKATDAGPTAQRLDPQ